MEYFDQPGIRAIAREAEANDYRMSSFILGVVNSDPFRMARPAPAVDDQEEEQEEEQEESQESENRTRNGAGS